MEDALLRVFPDKKDEILRSVGNNLGNLDMKPELDGKISDSSYLAAIELKLETIGSFISQKMVVDVIDVKIKGLLSTLSAHMDEFKKIATENVALTQKTQKLESELLHSKQDIKDLDEKLLHEAKQAQAREEKLLERIRHLDKKAADEVKNERLKQKEEEERLRKEKDEEREKTEGERIRKERDRIRKKKEELERIRKEEEAQRLKDEKDRKEKEEFERKKRDLKKKQDADDAKLKGTQTEGQKKVSLDELMVQFLKKLNERKGTKPEFKSDSAVDAKRFDNVEILKKFALEDIDLFINLSEKRSGLLDSQNLKDINSNLSKSYQNLRVLLAKYVHGTTKAGFVFKFQKKGAIHQILKGLLWIDFRIYKGDITVSQTFVANLVTYPKDTDIGGEPNKNEMNTIFASVGSLLVYYTFPAINVLFTKLRLSTVKKIF